MSSPLSLDFHVSQINITHACFLTPCHQHDGPTWFLTQCKLAYGILYGRDYSQGFIVNECVRHRGPLKYGDGSSYGVMGKICQFYFAKRRQQQVDLSACVWCARQETGWTSGPGPG